MIYKEPCPCCGEAMVHDFETCPICDWCNDYAQTDNPDLANMPNNDMSLNEARAAWQAKKKKKAA